MKTKQVYQCDYCCKTRATVVGMERHEAQCVHNPNTLNCFYCVNAFVGEWYSDYDKLIKSDALYCALTCDEPTQTNQALECEHYKKSETMYYTRSSNDFDGLDF